MNNCYYLKFGDGQGNIFQYLKTTDIHLVINFASIWVNIIQINFSLYLLNFQHTWYINFFSYVKRGIN
jgi:hypothetical protein